MNLEDIAKQKDAIKAEFEAGRCNVVEAITANAVLDMLAALVQMGKQFGIMP